MIKRFIKDCDNLGIEASLYYNKNDRIVKSILGGILSIQIYLLILAGGGFFFYQFVTRGNFTLISNSAVKNDINNEEFSKIPFMVRLSGRDLVLYPEGYYFIKLKVFNTVLGSSQTFKNYQMKPCDINNKYFSTKKEIFSAIHDINTYFCPMFEEDEFGVRGIYGSTDYSFGLLSFYMCVNDEAIGRTGCEDYNKIKKSLGETYVDFITLTNSIDHYNAVPYEEQIYQVRIPTSVSIFKRIWLYYQRIVYKTDSGYLFESIHTDTIFSIKDYSENIDIREFKDYMFMLFTFVNYESTITYTKSYMKAPTLLANIGGIIKGLSLIGYILNYPIAVNLFNLSLINTIYDKENSFKKIQQKNTFPNSIIARIGIQNNENFLTKKEDEIKNINIGDTINKHLITNQNQNANQILMRNNLNILNNNYITDNNDQNIANDNTNKNINFFKNNNNRLDDYLERVTKSNIVNNIPYSDILDNKNYDSVNINNNINDISNNNFSPDKRNKINYKKLPSIKKTMDSNNNDNISRIPTENTILARNTFKLSCLNMLDPFQICLNSEKKKQYLKRLRQAEECLNINNLITHFKELELIKNVLFEENQLVLLENLNKLNPDLEKMTVAYNNLMSKEYRINKIQSSNNINIQNNDNRENNDSINEDKFTKNYIDYQNNKTLDEKNLNTKLINLVDF